MIQAIQFASVNNTLMTWDANVNIAQNKIRQKKVSQNVFVKMVIIKRERMFVNVNQINKMI
jgi:hypothetical protein